MAQLLTTDPEASSQGSASTCDCPMTHEPKRTKTFHVCLDPEILARIDALVRRLSTGEGPSTRSEILRRLVRIGLEEHEKRQDPPTSSPRRRNGG